MEISGEEFLASNKARELFSAGKNWIVKLWRADGKEVSSINISPKMIGRNEGFIIDVSILGQEKSTRYYAKIQSVHIETVMIHNLLKFTKCGPEGFLIALLTNCDLNNFYDCPKHGVITREAENCVMASSWRALELQKLASHEKVFRTDSLLLTLFAALGRFGTLPYNRDNWGLVNYEAKIQQAQLESHSCLMIIDFSCTGNDLFIRSFGEFMEKWMSIAIRMFLTDFSKDYLFSKQSIVEGVTNVSWLQSKQALVDLLQCVCDATADWIVDTAESAGALLPVSTNNSEANPNCSSSTIILAALLSPFKHTSAPRLNSHHSSFYEILSMICGFQSWVKRWNNRLESFFQWFPFPKEPLLAAPETTLTEPPPAPLVLDTEQAICASSSETILLPPEPPLSREMVMEGGGDTTGASPGAASVNCNVTTDASEKKCRV